MEMAKDEEVNQIYNQIKEDEETLKNNLNSDLAPLVNHLKNKQKQEEEAQARANQATESKETDEEAQDK